MWDYIEVYFGTLIVSMYIPAMILAGGVVIVALGCWMMRRRIVNPFMWVDLVMLFAYPALWMLLLLGVVNPHVDSDRYSLIGLATIISTVLIFVRFAAIEVFVMAKSLALWWTVLLQIFTLMGCLFATRSPC